MRKKSAVSRSGNKNKSVQWNLHFDGAQLTHQKTCLLRKTSQKVVERVA
jgi:hypothetical protein